MKHSLRQFSAIEVCISSLYIWMGFFLLTALAQVSFAGMNGEKVLVALAASVAWCLLARIWLRQEETRDHPVNLVPLGVASLVALDLAAVVTS